MDNSTVNSTNISTDSNLIDLHIVHLLVKIVVWGKSTDFITVVNSVWISLQEDLLML